MTRILLFCLLLLLGTGPLAAQQIRVRSGEHENFSRLVFMYPAGTLWTVDPIEGGYRISTSSRSYRYELGEVFRYIPKTRIIGVRPDLDTRSLLIETAPGVHSSAFQLDGGALVLDIADGMGPDTETPVPTTGTSSFIPRAHDAYLGTYWNGTPRPDSNSPSPITPSPVHDTNRAIAASSTPKLPDQRVQAAESELLGQMARAASQGLITLDLASAEEKAPPQAENRAQPLPLEDAAPTEVSNHLALQSQTVIDRDMAAGRQSDNVSARGIPCPPDAEFDLQSWLTDAAPAGQIAEGRRDLVGEFDKPRADAIAKLARTYTALGFGVEARALYQSFGLQPDVDDITLAIADIIENRAIDPGSSLPAMTSCDGKAALWALMAHQNLPPKEEVNFGAILRGFSSLPSEIRELTGPRLSTKLIGLGAPDVARTVRSMLARSPNDHATALNLIDATIDLDAGRVSQATELLDEVAKTNSDSAADALVLSIENRLAQGAAIGQGDVENAAALAMQYSGTPTGATLRRAEILGRASTGDFARAFTALRRWENDEPDRPNVATRDDLFGLLAKVPDDSIFLLTYFDERQMAQAPPLPEGTQIALANRLSTNGFWQAAQEILSSKSRQTTEGHIALARAALAARDPAAAISHLRGAPGETASRLRGEALSILGQHETAQAEFAEIGDPTETVAEAWRSGNWPVVARHGTDLQKEFVSRFALPPESARPAVQEATTGPVGSAKALLEQSAADRRAYQEYMASQQLTAASPGR